MIESGQDLATTLGAGGVGIVLLGWMIRQVWRQAIGARTDGKISESDQAKAEADKVIYDNLRAEVQRMGEDITKIKDRHQREKIELEHRIAELEDKVTKLTYRLGSFRRKALDAYAKLINKDCPKCDYIDAAINDLKSIIEEE